MKINRQELVGLLKTLTPAVGDAKNAVQELSHVWFDGKYVSAFNDVLGIRIEFPTDFTGGMIGDKLIGVLDRSQAKDVDVGIDGDDVLLQIGRARIKLTRRPIEDWFWTPEIPETDGYAVTSEFREAIDLALMSVGAAKVLNPEQRGITIVQNGEAADLYSTDAVSLSWVKVKTGNKPITTSGDRLILPTLFCEQVSAAKGRSELRFDDNAVYCLTRLGESKESDKHREMVVFSRLVEEDEPVSFEGVVSQHVTENAGVEVPPQLKMRAERAMVLLDEQPLEIEVDDGNLYLYAQTPYGEIDDMLKLPGHANVKAKLDVSLLHRALDGRERLSISRSAVVVTGPSNFVHIIACK